MRSLEILEFLGIVVIGSEKLVNARDFERLELGENALVTYIKDGTYSVYRSSFRYPKSGFIKVKIMVKDGIKPSLYLFQNQLVFQPSLPPYNLGVANSRKRA